MFKSYTLLFLHFSWLPPIMSVVAVDFYYKVEVFLGASHAVVDSCIDFVPRGLVLAGFACVVLGDVAAVGPAVVGVGKLFGGFRASAPVVGFGFSGGCCNFFCNECRQVASNGGRGAACIAGRD